MAFNKNMLAIAFLIIIAELLVITFIIDATKNKIRESLITGAYEKEKTIAAATAKSLEQDLLAIADMLSLVAQSQAIQTGNASSCQEKLDEVFPVISKKIANLVRINEKGDIYCAVNRASIGINMLTNEDLKKLIKDPVPLPVLHRVVFSPVSNKYVAGIHVPVFTEKGDFKGSIGGAIYFDELEKKYFKDIVLLERGRLFLLDDNGDVLYHPAYPQIVGKNLLSKELLALMPEAQRSDFKNQLEQILADIQKNKVGFARYNYPPEPERIAVYHPVAIFENRHWAVVVTVPVEDIINQVDKDSLIAGFTNFSALAIATVAVVLITQISLFVYLIAHMSSHIKRMRMQQP